MRRNSKALFHSVTKEQLKCTPVGKAVPVDSAPATAWKACSQALAPALARVAGTLQHIDAKHGKTPNCAFYPNLTNLLPQLLRSAP